MKLTGDQFSALVMQISTPEGQAFSDEKFNEITEVLEKAVVEGNPPYAGDLENDTYKAIMQAIRDFNTSEMRWLNNHCTWAMDGYWHYDKRDMGSTLFENKRLLSSILFSFSF